MQQALCTRSPRCAAGRVGAAVAPQPAPQQRTRPCSASSSLLRPRGLAARKRAAAVAASSEDPQQQQQQDKEAVSAAVRQTLTQSGRYGDWLHTLSHKRSSYSSFLARGLKSCVEWLRSCNEARAQISSISPQQALQRMALVLGASLLLIVVISTIDGFLLQMYMLGARRAA